MSGKNYPVHVGIIMDGNGRWAKKRGVARRFGHKKGAEVMREIITYAEKSTDIKFLTFYAFSTENWSRPKEEVDALMELFEEYLDKIIRDNPEDSVSLRFIGDRIPLRQSLRDKMERIENNNPAGQKLTVFLAINYGGKQDITQAAAKLADLAAEGRLKAADITPEMLERELYTGDAPPADLIIRPSGELRLSNFLLWQSAYAELWFDDILWPDFKPQTLEKAVDDFNRRNRRFGAV